MFVYDNANVSNVSVPNGDWVRTAVGVKMDTENTASSTSTSTIYDVAKLAGVSIATVSRALSGNGQLKPATRDLVLATVKELRFVPNNSARGLSSGSKKVVGLLFVRTPSEDFLEIVQESLLFTDSVIRGAERTASDNGYSLLLGGVSGFKDDEIINKMISNCDGLILLDRTVTDRKIPEIAKRIPTVLLAGSGKSRSAMTVRVDNHNAMYDLARHLVEVHKLNQLAFLSGFANSPDSQARRQGFVEGAMSVGATVEEDPLWISDYTSSGAVAAIEKRLAKSSRLPQAVACANDQAAIGAIHALKGAGLTVSRDIAVTGFDDISVARHVHPPLTTIRQPIQQLGSAAVDALLGVVGSQKKIPPINTVLPTQIVYRQSCGCEQ
ncbi:catabolite control protein A [Acidithrix ferrooxidans]|uniref:Catabolite control protein A n=2 Tax=Acidimicrobiaceae TaxID=84994 RepID=A0A0D8HFW4_9ACTN|nr:catabolite control protein A [Acidithrix ferrooxidans]